ncbi:PTS mannitol transporter subunit IICB [uncultured Ilyobacter sp.]|uniref:PTS mannitol transporter subunit IICB n=1 Tax=uncultured Ilyobacter sp. TaxID=544433 RepID=UPI0029C753E9|nr:PTS mannitol transporter subunit IICB [uncultured Ilyobacter sp.]
MSKRAKIQAFGGFLTSIVIPNMGAFIAWGFITALFIPTGWLPSENFGQLVGPIIVNVLPILLGYTGGKIVGGEKGAIVGTMATAGLIVGSEIPMFLGAMVMGPLGGYVSKKVEGFIHGKIPTGFEMVVNNFSVGILGFLLCLLSYEAVGPAIVGLNTMVTVLVEKIISSGFLPLLSIINEPAKVLFLNNVIDQGIYYPLGMQQTAQLGKSILFTVASNPGPGLGILLAYSLFGKGMSKKSAPGAIIIHFFGGIHELYFPYVLMKPLMIIPMILGGMTGITIFSLTGVGLVAGPSPGSIFAYLALTPKGNFIGIIAGVLGATIVSLVTGMLVLKVDNKEKAGDEAFEESVDRSKAMKKEGKDKLNQLKDSKPETVVMAEINKIAFACDAGMGSSLMGANIFKRELEKRNIQKNVSHYAIEKVPEDVDVIVTHKSLKERTEKKFPDKRIIALNNFLKDEKLEEFLTELAG